MTAFGRILSATVKTAFVIIGAASAGAIVASAAYADKRLHETTDGYKFGPARHLEYFSAIIHKANRAIDSAAIETWRKAQDEDSKYYEELEDEHERLLAEAKRNGTWR